MAKLTTPYLKDTVPTVQSLGTVADRLIEVAVNGAPLSAVRLTVSNEAGSVGAVLLLSVGDDNGTPVWTDCSLAVSKDGAGPEVSARVNRLLKGFSLSRAGLVSGGMEPPKIGMNWRSKQVGATFRRRSYALPVHVSANPSLIGNSIITRWSVRTTPVVMDTNTAAGFSPLQKTQAPKRRTARGRSRSSQPTISQQVGATVTPTVTPVAPFQGASAKVNQTTIPVAPKRKVNLPATHPGIFNELAAQPYTVHVEPSVARKLDAAYRRFEAGKLTVVALRGPSGAGKTLTAMDLAARKGLPFAKFEIPALRDFSDWFGSVSLQERNGVSVTEYQPSDLAEAIRMDGPYAGIPRVIVFDEMTRAETAGAMNAALAIFDGRGSVYIPDARKSIVIDPTVLFIFTANIGANFVGAGTLDTAIANRVTSWIVVDYPPAVIEAKVVTEQSGVDAATSAKFVQVATQLRAMHHRGEIAAAPSTRQLVRVAEAHIHGLSVIEACEVGFADDAAITREGGDQSDFSRIIQVVGQVLR